ncbi:MAG: sigma-70 family RNA polymerase sigma factor [Planctomyces sp.]|nr:sigma-70 family RNA polymerase sigma factor [Planctomyces sp.]
MNLPPDTRASLLLRVRDPADQAAWHEFVEIYWPVIHRLARRKGLQTADADDIAQQVLFAVARAIERREHNFQRARFRTWLSKVAHNAILNALTRARPDRGAGGLEPDWLLGQHSRREGPDSDLLRLECRREVFRWAARQVRREFQDETWDAFWLTTVEGRTCEDAAQSLGKSVGSIYACRSRVMKRFREKVAEYDAAR